MISGPLGGRLRVSRSFVSPARYSVDRFSQLGHIKIHVVLGGDLRIRVAEDTLGVDERDAPPRQPARACHAQSMDVQLAALGIDLPDPSSLQQSMEGPARVRRRPFPGHALRGQEDWLDPKHYKEMLQFMGK